MEQLRRHDIKQKRFDALTRRLLPDLFRYAYWLNRDHALAQDIVQESLLRAWQAHPYCRYQSLDHHEEADLSTTTNTDVVDMRRALTELDDGYREPLVLQVLIGLTMKEIAEIMGMTPNTVCTRLFRAREKLRALLGKSKRLKQRDSRQPYHKLN